jgi:hypothetical protein
MMPAALRNSALVSFHSLSEALVLIVTRESGC